MHVSFCANTIKDKASLQDVKKRKTLTALGGDLITQHKELSSMYMRSLRASLRGCTTPWFLVSCFHMTFKKFAPTAACRIPDEVWICYVWSMKYVILSLCFLFPSMGSER